jgi:hypothetical protein
MLPIRLPGTAFFSGHPTRLTFAAGLAPIQTHFHPYTSTTVPRQMLLNQEISALIGFKSAWERLVV